MDATGGGGDAAEVEGAGALLADEGELAGADLGEGATVDGEDTEATDESPDRR